MLQSLLRDIITLELCYTSLDQDHGEGTGIICSTVQRDDGRLLLWNEVADLEVCHEEDVTSGRKKDHRRHQDQRGGCVDQASVSNDKLFQTHLQV